MNFQELHELLDYIQANNSWENQHDLNFVNKGSRKIIKYVDFCVDTRIGEIWMIRFRQGIEEVEFRDSDHPCLKDDIYKWLNAPDESLKKYWEEKKYEKRRV